VLLALSALLAVLFFVGVISDDLLIYWGYFLVILTAVITIIFPIVFMFMNPRGSIKIFIGIGLLVILAIISYALAGNSFTSLQLEKIGATAETSKFVGAGLIFTYILGGLAVLSIIYASISRIFK
jgi:hypothetical protein